MELPEEVRDSLHSGTFLLYRDVMAMRGTSASQLKPAKVIRNQFRRRFFFMLRKEGDGT